MVCISKTETYEHTINGLLKKRSEMFNEAERIRDRLAELKNDIGALDRTLETIGFKGDLDELMPRQRRHVIFGKGELTEAIVLELKNAERPLRSREIARELIALRGEDARDQRYLSDLTKRVSKALRILKQNGEVRSKADPKGNYLWEWV